METTCRQTSDHELRRFHRIPLGEVQSQPPQRHAAHLTLHLLAATALALGAFAGLAEGQTPAPAVNRPFILPLADGSTAAAVILPADASRSYLIFATSQGNLVWYTLTTKIDPQPPVPPVPPPPVPTTLTIAVVENPATTTWQVRAVLSSPGWRQLATTKHRFLGIIPIDAIDPDTKQPPAPFKPFLDRAKTMTLPAVIIADAAGNELTAGGVPATDADFQAVINRYAAGYRRPQTPCPTGLCPLRP